MWPVGGSGRSQVARQVGVPGRAAGARPDKVSQGVHRGGLRTRLPLRCRQEPRAVTRRFHQQLNGSDICAAREFSSGRGRLRDEISRAQEGAAGHGRRRSRSVAQSGQPSSTDQRDRSAKKRSRSVVPARARPGSRGSRCTRVTSASRPRALGFRRQVPRSPHPGLTDHPDPPPPNPPTPTPPTTPPPPPPPLPPPPPPPHPHPPHGLDKAADRTVTVGERAPFVLCGWGLWQDVLTQVTPRDVVKRVRRGLAEKAKPSWPPSGPMGGYVFDVGCSSRELRAKARQDSRRATWRRPLSPPDIVAVSAAGSRSPTGAADTVVDSTCLEHCRRHLYDGFDELAEWRARPSSSGCQRLRRRARACDTCAAARAEVRPARRTPGDRHRWRFSLDDARSFCRHAPRSPALARRGEPSSSAQRGDGSSRSYANGPNLLSPSLIVICRDEDWTTVRQRGASWEPARGREGARTPAAFFFFFSAENTCPIWGIRDGDLRLPIGAREWPDPLDGTGRLVGREVTLPFELAGPTPSARRCATSIRSSDPAARLSSQQGSTTRCGDGSASRSAPARI